ncbi:hypothetical protein [Pseudomonas phage vB_PaeP_Lx18]|uniref:Uncharacterized protein n=1 Tax=Pseudomonas phage vB_PaeP_Lx18 TaxID=2686072 RepID=A0A6B9LZJ8_9CAUD|nr:hypothetical protein [Pseudomonas phage vB_PaeP_Lx18]
MSPILFSLLYLESLVVVLFHSLLPLRSSLTSTLPLRGPWTDALAPMWVT